jgi:hypothetical protein
VVAGEKSHKSVSKSSNWFLRLYYTSRVCLTLLRVSPIACTPAPNAFATG